MTTVPPLFCFLFGGLRRCQCGCSRQQRDCKLTRSDSCSQAADNQADNQADMQAVHMAAGMAADHMLVELEGTLLRRSHYRMAADKAPARHDADTY